MVFPQTPRQRPSPRHHNITRSAQARNESKKDLSHLLRACGANVVANGKVTTQPPFQEGSVQAAVGAADLPDEAALLYQVSAALKAILRPTSPTTQTNRSSAPPVRPNRHRAPTRLGVPSDPRGTAPRFLRSVIPRMPLQYKRTIL